MSLRTWIQQTLSKLSQPNTSGLGIVWYIQIGSFHTSQDICKTLAIASSDAINDHRIVNLSNPTNDSSDSMKQLFIIPNKFLGTNISHLWKRKIILPATSKRDKLFPLRVYGVLCIKWTIDQFWTLMYLYKNDPKTNRSHVETCRCAPLTSFILNVDNVEHASKRDSKGMCKIRWCILLNKNPG